MMHISCTQIQGAKKIISQKTVGSWIRRSAHALRLAEVTVSVVLTHDAHMRQLNSRYRKIDRSTDVLSFSLSGKKNPLQAREVDGEIFINSNDVLRRVKAQRISKIRLTHFLLIHGLLHCLGFDHATKAQLRSMRAFEKKLCGKYVYYT